MVLFGGGLVLVNISWHTTLNLEEVIGVAIDLVCRRSRQAHDKRVEVIEDSLVLLKDGAVRLVHDNQVKVRWRIHAYAVVVAHGVDGIQDGGIGGKHDARVTLVLVLAQVATRALGQICPEGTRCL